MEPIRNPFADKELLAATFERTSALRVSLPPEADPVSIIPEGRERGFEVDRTTAQ